jgi:hemerythrin-like domain-containing protein
MKPIGPLMKEHRLIERMISLLDVETKHIKADNQTNVTFVIAAVDFIRTYADRTHHGKEENILFRDLAAKPLSAEHKKVMDELIQEHVFGRRVTAQVAEAADAYLRGDADSSSTILDCLTTLVDFYPKHIEKEDKHFFYPCLEYFSKAELDNMLDEFWEFDRTLIHEKYGSVVEKWESETGKLR